jgi:uncharacterized protein
MRSINSLITVLALSFASISAVGCATSGDQVDDEYADAESNASAPGKLDLYQSTDSQWRFRVSSGNGRVLMSSEAYSSRTNAINGALSVLENGVDPLQYQLNQGANGKYNLRLSAANAETIAFSQQYSTKSSAKRAIGSCVSAVTTYLDAKEASSSARVAVEAGASGQFHFNIHGADGSVLLMSEHYSSEALAWNGAFAVQDAAAVDGAFRFKTAADGRAYFTINALNGQIVAVSKMFDTQGAAEQGAADAKGMLAALDVL